MYAMTGERSVDAVCVVSERNAWIYDTDMGYRIMEAGETPLYQTAQMQMRRRIRMR